MEVTVKIFENRMTLTANGNYINIKSAKPFTTKRLLIGVFSPAADCLKEGLSKLGAIGLLKKKPSLIIIPQEMTEDGLSEVEMRCLLEVGHSAGARKVEVRTA